MVILFTVQFTEQSVDQINSLGYHEATEQEQLTEPLLDPIE